MLGELNLLRISSVVMAAYLMAAYAMSGSWVEWRVYIKGVPTVVFLDSRGKERRDLRLADFLPADQFLNRMAEAMKTPGPETNFRRRKICSKSDSFLMNPMESHESILRK